MKTNEIIEFLENTNKWRRGEEGARQPNATELGKVIDAAIDRLRTLEKTVESERIAKEHFRKNEVDALVDLAGVKKQ